MPAEVLKASARELMLKSAPRFFFVVILYFLSVTGLSWLLFRLPGAVDVQNMYQRLSAGDMFHIGMLYRDFKPQGIVLAIVLYFLRPALDVGFMKCCLKVKRGGIAKYSDVFGVFRHFAKIAVIFAATSFLVLLWSLLLIVPGIIAAYRYRLAYYILLDDPSKGVLQCIDESVSMMRGGKLDLLIIDFSFVGWFALDMLVVLLLPLSLPFTLRIVLIWLAPYRGLTNAGFYEDRKERLMV